MAGFPQTLNIPFDKPADANGNPTPGMLATTTNILATDHFYRLTATGDVYISKLNGAPDRLADAQSVQNTAHVFIDHVSPLVVPGTLLKYPRRY